LHSFRQGEELATVTRLSRSIDWLPVGPASRLIGVDPGTLRRWADEGRVEHLTTAGGHRRFRREALEPFLRSGAPSTPNLSRLGATPTRLASLYRRRYQTQSGGLVAGLHLRLVERDAFRVEGRKLVVLLLRHLDEGSPANRSAALDDAVQLVRAIGSRMALRGTSLTDVVGLFIEARRPFLVELGAAASRRRLRPDELADVYERASAAFDRLLLELIDGYGAKLDRDL
jgi:excisionase family DNA binding protein